MDKWHLKQPNKFHINREFSNSSAVTNPPRSRLVRSNFCISWKPLLNPKNFFLILSKRLRVTTISSWLGCVFSCTSSNKETYSSDGWFAGKTSSTRMVEIFKEWWFCKFALAYYLFLRYLTDESIYNCLNLESDDALPKNLRLEEITKPSLSVSLIWRKTLFKVKFSMFQLDFKDIAAPSAKSATKGTSVIRKLCT